MTPQENAAQLTRLFAEVRGHCMCAKLEDTGTHYRAYCPPGYAIDAVQACYLDRPKSKALQDVLGALERQWQAAAL